jgi:hypothetical protein
MTPAVSGSSHAMDLQPLHDQSPLAVHGQKSSLASLALLPRIHIEVRSLDVGVTSAMIRK